jgi:tRNA(His) 5'-end guanylyltransferase
MVGQREPNGEVVKRMESYRGDHHAKEILHDLVLPGDQPLVLRLDGRAFHTLTQNMQRPFDVKFEEAMHAACEALLHDEIGFELVYTQSDEITAVMPAGRIPFSGRAQKLLTVSASICSAAFSMHLGRAGHFDARVISCQDDLDVLGVLAERQGDAVKNAVSMLTHWTLIDREQMSARQAARALQSMSFDQRVKLCEHLGAPFNEQPGYRRHGRLCRRVTLHRLGVNPVTMEVQPYTRRQIAWADPCPDFRYLNAIPGDAFLSESVDMGTR